MSELQVIVQNYLTSFLPDCCHDYGFVGMSGACQHHACLSRLEGQM